MTKEPTPPPPGIVKPPAPPTPPEKRPPFLYYHEDGRVEMIGHPNTATMTRRHSGMELTYTLSGDQPHEELLAMIKRFAGWDSERGEPT